jgi:hypothetical protein
MSHHLQTIGHIDEAMTECITQCSECHDICLATVLHCLQPGGVPMDLSRRVQAASATSGLGAGAAGPGSSP